MRVAGIAVNVRTPLKYLISSQAVENRDIGYESDADVNRLSGI